MLLNVGEKVYLQNYVISRLAKEVIDVPTKLLFEIGSNMGRRFTDRNPNEGARFDFRIEDPSNVEYLRNCGYIPDFGELSQKSVDELFALKQKRIDDHNAFLHMAKGMYQGDLEMRLMLSYNKCDLYCEGIWLLVGIKQRKIEMPTLPEGLTIEIPELAQHKPHDSKIRNFIESLRHRKK